jgi:hypothetical protein
MQAIRRTLRAQPQEFCQRIYGKLSPPDGALMGVPSLQLWRSFDLEHAFPD